MPAHTAAEENHVHVLRVLLAARPEAALLPDCLGRTPLLAALAGRSVDATRYLLELGPHVPSAELLETLGEFSQYHDAGVDHRPLLFALIASHQPLSADDWALVPTPCPALAAALPAVLKRSTTEAGLLVRRLRPADRHRLCAAALCLSRVQRRLSAPLPVPLVQCMLALCVAP